MSDVAGMELQAAGINLGASRINEATGALNLAAVLLGTALGLSKVGVAFLEIVAREGADEETLGVVIKAARFFAAPNQNGHIVLKHSDADVSLLLNTRMTLATSLGKMLIHDPAVHWLVTTHVVLAKHGHNSEDLSCLFTDITISRIGEKSEVVKTITQNNIKEVSDKLVESITYATTNVKSQPILVYERLLSSLCGHLMHPRDLASSMRLIQECAEKGQSCLIVMTVMPRDLLAWVFFHWKGLLTFTVANQKMYEKGQGQKLSIIVNEACAPVFSLDPDMPPPMCQERHKVTTVTVARLFDTDRQLDTSSREARETTWSAQAASDPRRELLFGRGLYDLRSGRSGSAGSFFQLSPVLLLEARRTAGKIVGDFIRLRCTLDWDGGPCLTVRPSIHPIVGQSISLSSELGPRPIEWWMAWFPLVFDKNVHPPSPTELGISLTWQDAPGAAVLPPNDYSRLYALMPILHSAVKSACRHCPLHDGDCSRAQTPLGPGCSGTEMMLVLLGHLADSFIAMAGQQDAAPSSVHRERDIIAKVKSFFDDFARTKQIRWNPWFRLVCSGITGAAVGTEERENYRTEPLVMWKAEEVTLHAKWLALDWQMPWSLRSSWGVDVMHYRSPQSVLDAQAVVRSASLPPSSFPTERQPMAFKPSDRREINPTEVHPFTAILPSEMELGVPNRRAYRFVTIESTQNSERFFSPGHAYVGMAHLRTVSCLPTCTPPRKRTKDLVFAPYNIDHLLHIWSGEAGHGRRIAFLPNSWSNQNIPPIALAAGYYWQGLTVQNAMSGCCLGCLWEQMGENGHAIYHGEDYGR